MFVPKFDVEFLGDSIELTVFHHLVSRSSLSLSVTENTVLFSADDAILKLIFGFKLSECIESTVNSNSLTFTITLDPSVTSPTFTRPAALDAFAGATPSADTDFSPVFMQEWPAAPSIYIDCPPVAAPFIEDAGLVVTLPELPVQGDFDQMKEVNTELEGKEAIQDLARMFDEILGATKPEIPTFPGGFAGRVLPGDPRLDSDLGRLPFCTLDPKERFQLAVEAENQAFDFDAYVDCLLHEGDPLLELVRDEFSSEQVAQGLAALTSAPVVAAPAPAAPAAAPTAAPAFISGALLDLVLPSLYCDLLTLAERHLTSNLPDNSVWSGRGPALGWLSRQLTGNAAPANAKDAVIGFMRRCVTSKLYPSFEVAENVIQLYNILTPNDVKMSLQRTRDFLAETEPAKVSTILDPALLAFDRYLLPKSLPIPHPAYLGFGLEHLAEMLQG